MFSLKNAVHSLNGQLQKAIVIGAAVLLVVLPTWHATMPIPFPCGDGCQSVVLNR